MVMGIGGTATVMGVLEDVPVHVGTGPVHPPAIVRVDFRVLSGKGYSLILGRQFLMSVRGVIDLHAHTLHYTTPAGTKVVTTIPLSQAKKKPIYQEVRDRLQSSHYPRTCLP